VRDANGKKINDVARQQSLAERLLAAVA